MQRLPLRRSSHGIRAAAVTPTLASQRRLMLRRTLEEDEISLPSLDRLLRTLFRRNLTPTPTQDCRKGTSRLSDSSKSSGMERILTSFIRRVLRMLPQLFRCSAYPHASCRWRPSPSHALAQFQRPDRPRDSSDLRVFESRSMHPGKLSRSNRSSVRHSSGARGPLHAVSRSR